MSQLSVKGSGGGGGGGTTIPAGAIMAFAGASVPSGWLALDGSAVSRTGQAALFSAIGTTYGVGDGTTTFNVPDTRRRSLFGKGSADALGDSDAVAAASRTLTHTHSVPAHNHAMGTGADLNITSSGAHVHTSDFWSHPGSGGITNLTQSAGAQDTVNEATNSASHTHPSGNFAGRIGLVTGGVDGNAAMTSGNNATGNYLVVQHIIKT